MDSVWRCAFISKFKHKDVNNCTLDLHAAIDSYSTVDVIIVITLKAFLLLKHI